MGKCLQNNNMEYKFKPISINVDDVEAIAMPAFEDRVIEKYGDVITFTYSEVKANLAKLEKYSTEMTAQIKHADSVMENIKSYHPHIAEMSDQDLLTAWMYKESLGEKQKYSDKLAQVQDAIEADTKMINEIKEQLPELKRVDEVLEA